jgi:hypothetical protein
MRKNKLSKSHSQKTQKRAMPRMRQKVMATDIEESKERKELPRKEIEQETEENVVIAAPVSAKRGVHNGLETLDLIFEPCRPKEYHGIQVSEGFRFGALGETGTGKTTLIRTVLIAALQRKHGLFIFAHDTKGVIPEYPESVQLSHPNDFKARGGFHSKEPHFVSFRGDPIRDVVCPVEDVAASSLEIARKGRTINGHWVTFPHVVCIDELAAAATEGRRGWDSPSTLKLFEQGRKIGVSTVWTTQSPRKCPPDAMGQSSSVAIFRLTGTDRNNVRDTLLLEGGIVDAISDLPDHHFLLYRKAQKWDGVIYKLPKGNA